MWVIFFIHANGNFHPFIRNCEQEWVGRVRALQFLGFLVFFCFVFVSWRDRRDHRRPAGRPDFVASTWMVGAVAEEQHRMSCLKQNRKKERGTLKEIWGRNWDSKFPWHAGEEEVLLIWLREAAMEGEHVQTTADMKWRGQTDVSNVGSQWPTIDGPLGVYNEEAVKLAKSFYYGGFLLLPVLWFVNCFYFWPVV